MLGLAFLGFAGLVAVTENVKLSAVIVGGVLVLLELL